MASWVSANVPEMFASVEVAAAYTVPLASTARPRAEPVSEVSQVVPEFVKLVVDAYVEKVDDATSESGEPVSHRPVEVEFTVCPLYAVGVNANALPVGHVVRQVSPVRHSVVAESAVVDA